MIRFAIVGMGIRGRLFAQAILQNPESTLVAVSDTNPQVLKRTAQEFNVPGYASWAELLEREKLDAACVCTPDFAHREPAILAAQAGLHLFIEKPLAMSTEDCQAIRSAVEKAGAQATVALINRFNPYYLRAREAIEAGELGQILSVNFRANDTLWVATDMLSWTARTTPAWFLWPHGMDLANWLTKRKARSVYGTGVKQKLVTIGIDSYDLIHAIVQYEDGTDGVFESSWVLPNTMPNLVYSHTEIIGSEGSLFLDLHDQGIHKCTAIKMTYPSVISEVKVAGRLTGREFMFFDTFVDNLVQGTPPMVSLEEAEEVCRTIEAVHQSVQTGQVVTL
jgi:predicted dehydrogenase